MSNTTVVRSFVVGREDRPRAYRIIFSHVSYLGFSKPSLEHHQTTITFEEWSSPGERHESTVHWEVATQMRHPNWRSSWDAVDNHGLGSVHFQIKPGPLAIVSILYLLISDWVISVSQSVVFCPSIRLTWVMAPPLTVISVDQLVVFC